MNATVRIWCCDCGTELVCCDPDATTKLALCSGCWNRLPAAVIVERSKAHQLAGHAAESAHGLPVGGIGSRGDESMTRAYLRTDKKRWIHGPHMGLRPDLYDSDRAFLAAESCHEAQRILSETEPETIDTGYRMTVVSPGCRGEKAFAEALATFINASIE